MHHVLTGDPGVGKTGMIFYALPYFLDKGWTVFLQMNEDHIRIFTPYSSIKRYDYSEQIYTLINQSFDFSLFKVDFQYTICPL